VFGRGIYALYETSLQKKYGAWSFEKKQGTQVHQDEEMSEIESKVSGGCAQKVGVMEGDKVSSFLSSLCVKLQFQIIIQYSREHKGWICDGELKKNTLD